MKYKVGDKIVFKSGHFNPAHGIIKYLDDTGYSIEIIKSGYADTYVAAGYDYVKKARRYGYTDAHIDHLVDFKLSRGAKNTFQSILNEI